MRYFHLLACGALLAALPALAQENLPPAPVSSSISGLARTTNTRQKPDADYTKKIRANTTDPMFLTELVDHLPASETVPTPQKTLGYIAGEAGHLRILTRGLLLVDQDIAVVAGELNRGASAVD